MEAKRKLGFAWSLRKIDVDRARGGHQKVRGKHA